MAEVQMSRMASSTILAQCPKGNILHAIANLLRKALLDAWRPVTRTIVGPIVARLHATATNRSSAPERLDTKAKQ